MNSDKFEEEIFSSGIKTLDKIIIQSTNITTMLNKLTNECKNNSCKTTIYSELKQLIKLCKKMRGDINNFLEIKYTIDYLSEVCSCDKYKAASDNCAINYDKIIIWTSQIENQISSITKYCKH